MDSLVLDPISGFYQEYKISHIFLNSSLVNSLTLPHTIPQNKPLKVLVFGAFIK